MNNYVLSVEAAWVCAAEVDVQRVEGERKKTRAGVRKQNVKDKYKLTSVATRLDRELQEQQLQWMKKIEQRRPSQLSPKKQVMKNDIGQIDSSMKTRKGSIYAMENLRLAMLMKDTKLRQRVKKKKVRPRVVQDMLTLEHRCAEAARKLQKWWQEYLHRQAWRLYFRQVMAAVQLQRVARGFLTRRWVRIWHANRATRVTRLQALFRGHCIRYTVLPTWKRWEYLNATKIQSIVRVYFAKKSYLRCKREVAALHIQSVWRGVSSRKRSDIRWLEIRAINLQRMIRGALARKQTRRRAMRLTSGAIQIQRMFRGMKARMEINVLLRNRETRNRQEFMAVLEAEEEWHRTQREKLQSRLQRKQLQQRVAQLEYDYFVKHEQIHDMESIYLDMQTQRLRVSPRAIDQGWVEVMEVKMKQQRALITKAKLETIFGLGLEFKQREKELVECQQRINELEEKRRRFETWRNEEFWDYWKRECRFGHQAKQLQRRRKIAETRRRWQIQLYRANGKRDKRWRGTCWSPEVLESAKEKEVFCIGSTDILAWVHNKWRYRMEETESKQALNGEENERKTREHIRDLTDQVALTAATSQIEQTKALFDPVFRHVENSFDTVQMQQHRHDKRLSAMRGIQDAAGIVATKQNGRSITTKDRFTNDKGLMHEQDGQQRKRQLLLAAKVPWHLLDQLEAERRKLAQEKTMFKLWGKSSFGE